MTKFGWAGKPASIHERSPAASARLLLKTNHRRLLPFAEQQRIAAEVDI